MTARNYPLARERPIFWRESPNAQRGSDLFVRNDWVYTDAGALCREIDGWMLRTKLVLCLTKPIRRSFLDFGGTGHMPG